MKIISVITLISLVSICAFWYIEIATPFQKEYVKNKASKAGSTIQEKSIEIYEKKGNYFDKVKEISESISDKYNEVTTTKPNLSILENINQYHESHIYAGNPIIKTYPNQIKVLENIGFVVGYDEKRKNPAWVCYRLFEDKIEKAPKRPSRFSIDKRTFSEVSHNDYTHSGFDRGHMAPNYAIALRYGIDAQKETFLMSNITPQSPELNQGPWRMLEEDIGTKWANEFKMIWITTGPIYDASVESLRSNIEIPDAFYKIIIDEEPNGKLSVASYILEQTINRKENYQNHSSSVDLIETLTGLDFFSELDDLIETKLESVNSSNKFIISTNK